MKSALAARHSAVECQHGHFNHDLQVKQGAGETGRCSCQSSPHRSGGRWWRPAHQASGTPATAAQRCPWCLWRTRLACPRFGIVEPRAGRVRYGAFGPKTRVETTEQLYYTTGVEIAWLFGRHGRSEFPRAGSPAFSRNLHELPPKGGTTSARGFWTQRTDPREVFPRGKSIRRGNLRPRAPRIRRRTVV